MRRINRLPAHRLVTNEWNGACLPNPREISKYTIGIFPIADRSSATSCSSTGKTLEVPGASVICCGLADPANLGQFANHVLLVQLANHPLP